LGLFATSSVAAAQSAPRAADFGGAFIPREKRGKGQRNRRGKGKVSRPKSKPNRLHISKRVRRKHRRAA
jgi:hypothetical protein